MKNDQNTQKKALYLDRLNKHTRYEVFYTLVLPEIFKTGIKPVLIVFRNWRILNSLQYRI